MGGRSAVAAAVALLQAGAAAEAQLRSSRGLATAPRVAPQWSAALHYEGTLMGMNLTRGVGRYFYDSPNQRHRFTFRAGIDLFYPDGHFDEDRIFTNDTAYPSANFTVNGKEDGACMPVSVPYSDPFTWIDGAALIGERELQGQACAVWTRLVRKADITGTLTYNMTACVTAAGIPLELSSAVPGDGKFSGFEHYRFSGVVLGPPGDEAFANTGACRKWPPPPCQDAEVSTLDIYRIFGPPEPEELQNRDSGDALGDLSFMCTQGSGAAYHTKLIAHWRVKVSNAFGQYALCNYNGTANRCDGAPSLLARVGRRSAQYQGHPVGGQCTPNSDTGSQYSFPEQARCPPGVEPSAGGCAFSGARVVKTVSASCLFEERGLMEACKRDMGHAPFVEAKQIFEAAFASDEPELGGCPPAEAAWRSPPGGELAVLV